MMSLLSVTVKKALFVGVQASQFNSYVTLKLQNVKSTTVTVKGATPCWEQDFLFETNDMNIGLLIEVWNKGMLWDRGIGYHYLPLQNVNFAAEEGNGQWLSLDAELVMRDGEVVGTKNPTGNSLLVDYRFELPFDPESAGAADIQRKLEMLNNIMDQETRAEQARRQMQYLGHSGYSEDSDYTSDLNYPVGQHPNSSASQFRTAVNQMQTPQRSNETSRENSYEKDECTTVNHHYLPTPPTQYDQHLSTDTPNRHSYRNFNQRNLQKETIDYGYNYVEDYNLQNQDNSFDCDPLSYNSRPPIRNKQSYKRRRNIDWNNEESQETWSSYERYYDCNQPSIESDDGKLNYQNDTTSNAFYSKGGRRPSLERQSTLYDEPVYETGDYYQKTNNNQIVSYVDVRNQSFNSSMDEYYDASSQQFQNERYGPEDEDRQWDSGGYQPPKLSTTSKKLPEVPTVHNRSNTRLSFRENFLNGYPYTRPKGRRKMPEIPTRRCNSKLSTINDYGGVGDQGYYSRRGASLPPTPTKAPKLLPRIENEFKPFNSLPGTPGRKLPQPNLKAHNSKIINKSISEGNSYEDSYFDDKMMVRIEDVDSKLTVYNEDYNYAYESIDNLPEQQFATEQYETESKKFGGYLDDYQPLNINDESNYQSTNDNEYYTDSNDYGKEVEKSQYFGNRGFSEVNQTSVSMYGQPVTNNVYTFTPIKTEGNENYVNSQMSKSSFLTTTTTSTSLTNSQYQWDQTPQSKAIEPVVSTSEKTISSRLSSFFQQPISAQLSNFVSNATSALTAGSQNSANTSSSFVPTAGPGCNTNSSKNFNSNRGMLRQQKSIEQEDYDKINHQQSEQYDRMYLQDMNRRNSIESYVEDLEEELDQTEFREEDDYGIEHQDMQAITTKESQSPASVIFKGEGDDSSLRRGSSQVTVVDPYHTLSQRAAADSLITNSRRSSEDPRCLDKNQANVPQVDSVSVGEDQFGFDANKSGSSLEAVHPSELNRHASVRQTSAVIVNDAKHLEEPTDAELKEEMLDQFEERHEEPETIRPKVTAQQRWLWAYNKIIMQLNVSVLTICTNMFQLPIVGKLVTIFRLRNYLFDYSFWKK